MFHKRVDKASFIAPGSSNRSVKMNWATGLRYNLMSVGAASIFIHATFR
jgi:hypothetical protein